MHVCCPGLLLFLQVLLGRIVFVRDEGRWRVAVCACLKEVFVCDCGLQSGYRVSVNGRWQL